MSRALATLAMASSLVATSACDAAAGNAHSVCFTAKDNRRLAFAVIQQAPPPPRHDAAYRYYPLTAVATMQMATLGRAPGGIDRYFFHWANRSNAPRADSDGRIVQRKPNLQPSALGLRRQRTAFSTVARADACTMAQLSGLLGAPDEAKADADTAGIALVSETRLADDGGQGPQDACVLAAGTLPDAVRGVLRDFEVADGRGADEARALLLGYAARVHRAGRRAILLIDPFDAPSQRLTGITSDNAAAIVDAFDATTLMLWGGNSAHSIPASYRAQRAIIDAASAVDPQRLIVDFDLAGTSVEDAAFVHETIERDHLGGVIFWRNHAEQGGDCASPVNRKIATVLFGQSPQEHAGQKQDRGVN